MIPEESKLNDIEMQPRSEKFNANIYNVWKKLGGELITMSPADKAEFDNRMSSVGDAVMRDKPVVREMFELMKRAAERTRDK